ncbi:MAG: hypothetical protein RLZZ299_1765 [Pseudomonadota bacterium]
MRPPGGTLMRVLHVDTASEDRGGQRQLAYLLTAPDSAGDGWAGDPCAPLAARVGGPVVALCPGNDPRNGPRLARALRQGPWDVVAAHTPHAFDAALVARALLRAAGRHAPPVVVHRRVDFVPRHPWKLRMADAIVAVSAAVAGVLGSAGVPGARVVHDGVAPSPPGPAYAEAFAMGAGGHPPATPPASALPRPWLLAAGALVPHKGHDVLLDAFAALPGSLVLAGQGPLRTRLARRVTAPDLRGRVALPGQLPGLGTMFGEVDALVHPSREEGFGQVVLEALLAGTRVIATSAGGLPEALGPAAWLAAPGDATSLRERLRTALGSPVPDLRAHAARHDVARMVAGTRAVYADALSRARS